MIFVTLSPAWMSLLLLAAHFYRGQNLVLAVLALVLLALLGWRRPWVPDVLQAALVLGALEWLRTLMLLVQERTALGHPHLRLTLILGLVAALTALSALVFRSARARSYFMGHQAGK